MDAGAIKAADAKVDFMRARRNYLSSLSSSSLYEVYAAQAKLELERAWRQRLIDEARLERVRADRLEVLCLRWNKESVLIAATAALRAWAGQMDRVAALDELSRLLAETTDVDDGSRAPLPKDA